MKGELRRWPPEATDVAVKKVTQMCLLTSEVLVWPTHRMSLPNDPDLKDPWTLQASNKQVW